MNQKMFKFTLKIRHKTLLHSFCLNCFTKLENEDIMNTLKKYVFSPFLAIVFTISSLSQLYAQVPDEIILSLQTGNAKVLASYFNQNVELVILDSDNIYSKAQAEQIVTNFFSRNQPTRFTELHSRGKEDAHYVIGNLVTRQETFRVYFLMKKTGGKDIIHQLRIEKQE
jgi:hypothetical protein